MIDSSLLTAEQWREAIDARIEAAWQILEQTPDSAAAQVAAVQNELSASTAPFDYPLAIAACQVITATYYHHLTRTEEAITLCMHALPVLKAHPPTVFLGRAYGCLGITHFRNGDFSIGLQYFREQRDISVEIGDPMGVARGHVGVGLIFNELGEADRAISAFKLALDIYRTYEIRSRQIVVLSNMCFAYNRSDRALDALEVGLEALQLCESPYRDSLDGLLMQNVSEAYLRLDEIAAARDFAETALVYASASRNRFTQTISYVNLGRVLISSGDLDTAEGYLAKAVQLCIDTNLPVVLRDAYFEQYRLYKARGDFEHALQAHERFYTTVNNVFSQEQDARIRKIEVAYRIRSAEEDAQRTRKYNDELTRRVEERTNELRDALQREQNLAQELEAALKQEAWLSETRSRIITTVSHEFKTPMTTINTSADLLYKFQDKMSPQKRETMFSRIRESVFYLNDLLQDATLIDRANADNVIVETKAWHFVDLCDELASQCSGELGYPTHTHFEYSQIETTLEADITLLKRILLNLLTNAIKYSPEDERIFTKIQLEGQTLTLTVQDNGVGIPHPAQSQLFDLFYRAENVESQRGLGLGLYIVKKLCDKLGGRVCVKSAGENCGATFTVTLPVSTSALIS